MIITDVVAEVQDVLATISGLRVPRWGEQTSRPPYALVAVPTTVRYDVAYARGCDGIDDLQIMVICGRPESVASLKIAAPFVDGSGPSSVKAAMHGHAWVACMRARVQTAEFQEAEIVGDSNQLAVVFHTQIIGRGVTT